MNCVVLVTTEIPLFHVLNARITFGNIFAVDSPAPGVSCLRGETEDAPYYCVVDDTCFDPPPSYTMSGRR